MPCLFPAADDVHDAAADAVRCIDARLSRRGLQLGPSDWEALRDAVVEALGDAEVVAVES